MMIKVAGPGGGAVSPLYLEDRKPKLPKWAWGAIAVSAALHVGAGAWLYYQKFVMPELTATEDKPGTIDILTLPKELPPPTEQKHDPIKRVAPIHKVETPVKTETESPFPAQKAENTEKGAPIATQTVEETKPDGSAIVEQPVKAGPKIITRPQWVSRPSADQMARYYPPAALADGTTGEATLRCSVMVSGKVTGCQVMAEAPRSRGFGNAALKLARFFVMSPQTVDGQPVEGGQVTFTVKFNLQ